MQMLVSDMAKHFEKNTCSNVYCNATSKEKENALWATRKYPNFDSNKLSSYSPTMKSRTLCPVLVSVAKVSSFKLVLHI